MIPFRLVRNKSARPIVWGHRGAKAHAPENTMPSFVRALDDGADGLELDVRTTRDGAVVVLHDPDLRRVTSGRDLRRAQDLDAREIAAVELDGGARAPMLAEVLELAAARSCLLNVELKHDAHDKATLARSVARLLRGHLRLVGRVLFSSFDPELLARVALLVPDVPRALLVHDGQRLAKTPVGPMVARMTGAIALHPERTMCSHARVDGWRRRGLLLNVWTVNDEREALDLASLAVDGIITDDPGRIVRALEDRYRAT